MVNNFLRILVFTVAINFCLIYCLSASEIVLKPYTQVQSREVLMNDIVADGEDLPEEIGEIVVKKINRPGIKVIIQVKKIRKILKNKGYDYKIIHPDRKMYIRAEIPVIQINLDYLNEIVYESIQDKINLQNDEKLQIEWRYSNLKFPENFDVRIDKYSQKYRKVFATIFWDGIKLRSITGKVQIERCYRVISARYDLEKGHKITSEDIIEEVHYSLRKIPEISEDELIGNILIRQHRAGEIIKKAYLKKEIVVNKGQKVRIFKNSGGLSIALSGMALTSGGIGDLIKVRSLGTKNIYSCQINDKKIIEIY